MANPDPMDGGRFVRLSLHPAQIEYLRSSVGHIICGFVDDVAGHPDDPSVPSWEADMAAYQQLDDGLASDEGVTVNGRIERLVRHWLAAHDLHEEFGRICFEHQTLASLRDQIEATR